MFENPVDVAPIESICVSNNYNILREISLLDPIMNFTKIIQKELQTSAANDEKLLEENFPLKKFINH